ncbi:aspartate 1-decarboxylase [Salinicoccus hispanicus]|uniref:Aspartate 1-decarboxylase n=1 Tax=Salinicoccus hispanicus TaxID=157225 RepID=A0A6N8U2P1_9STAP|nr:aspartate 1-decarboxylase [Salinicoccus hispanicus]MXQ49939.1 aspartate 1-decarboxylase [Salinicoccus hispanicus]
MIRTMMNGKIHRAVVTEANLNYVGSITIDPVLLEAANILPNELVQIVNNNNGERLETYVIEGERGSNEICLNGAAARKVQIGDVIIIISYVQLDESELAAFEPNVVIVDEQNNIVEPKYFEKRQTEYTHQGSN